jgi:hypothetical protein
MPSWSTHRLSSRLEQDPICLTVDHSIVSTMVLLGGAGPTHFPSIFVAVDGLLAFDLDQSRAPRSGKPDISGRLEDI